MPALGEQGTTPVQSRRPKRASEVGLTDHYFVLSKDLLGLCTNVASFKWSFGITAPAATREAFEACTVRLRLHVGEVPTPPEDERLGKYHYFSGVPGADALYYSRRFLLNSELRLAARGLLTDEPTFFVNRTYHRYLKHRFMNLHSIGYILTDLAALLLLRRGYATIHCSAFRKDDATVIVFAPPNTGKTLSTMMACKQGAQFLAEDFAITDGRTVHAVPWTSTFRYYSDVEGGLWSRAVRGLTALFPPLELLPLQRSKPIDSYLDRHAILDHSPLTHVVILERGPTGVHEEPLDEAYRKIANLNRFEFKYTRAPLLVAYEFFNPALDIAAAATGEAAVLRQTVLHARRRLVVRALDATQYAPLILGALA